MVILLDASVEVTGDIVETLAAPLRDPGVGVAGPWGFTSQDLRHCEDAPSRRAVAVDLPATRHEHRGWTSLPAAERDRLSKRNFYRVLDRFGGRRDLLISASVASGSSR